jgi:hypothetical protein
MRYTVRTTALRTLPILPLRFGSCELNQLEGVESTANSKAFSLHNYMYTSKSL